MFIRDDQWGITGDNKWHVFEIEILDVFSKWGVF